MKQKPTIQKRNYTRVCECVDMHIRHNERMEAWSARQMHARESSDMSNLTQKIAAIRLTDEIENWSESNSDVESESDSDATAGTGCEEEGEHWDRSRQEHINQQECVGLTRSNKEQQTMAKCK